MQAGGAACPPHLMPAAPSHSSWGDQHVFRQGPGAPEEQKPPPGENSILALHFQVGLVAPLPLPKGGTHRHHTEVGRCPIFIAGGSLSFPCAKQSNFLGQVYLKNNTIRFKKITICPQEAPWKAGAIHKEVPPKQVEA